ncbi:Lrp/AsnC family transcriptional regulator [Parahaliea mediterranea]|uniref:Lrp/AsnC family transcriptional regulator n=1 Tax=Parahaliea mediterranea TaxID=651086 RepID=A0A939IP09_9GAMM|nr:Lrp/AsnC family transcriptional regulator [Parahaliea mediterranea]MBN7798587.1 Lrp/AsnC family transcriptional regulator [Parahaliea mediterranea]
MKLDKTDRKILALLQRDASLSASDIAERVNLSQPPCWRRIKRLEEAGVIQRRVALLDQRLLGLNVTVFARVKLSAHGKKSLPEFEQQIGDIPEVLECHTVMGDYDFLLKIVTRDIDAYEVLFRTRLSQMPTVQEIHSNAAISRIKITTELPLEDGQLKT